jgi:hypothetical protein
MNSSWPIALRAAMPTPSQRPHDVPPMIAKTAQIWIAPLISRIQPQAFRSLMMYLASWM